jgi:hypothetical protein
VDARFHKITLIAMISASMVTPSASCPEGRVISGEQDAQISQGGGDLQDAGSLSNAHSATIHTDSLGSRTVRHAPRRQGWFTMNGWTDVQCAD